MYFIEIIFFFDEIHNTKVRIYLPIRSFVYVPIPKHITRLRQFIFGFKIIL